jgi:hypothetical protein
VIVQRIPETRVQAKPLGRHVNHDPRSRAFAAQTAPVILSVRHQSIGLPLTQIVGSCTAEALIGALNCAPNSTGNAYTQVDAEKLYTLETQMEGQPYPPNDPGGSGLEVCKAAVQMGLIVSYQHTFDLWAALGALVLRPVIAGVNWYTSFDTPDPSGLVTITSDASVRGGHEILADEIDKPNQLVWFTNSWGPDYGVAGRFCMQFDTFGRLLSEQGDVTVPIR